MKTTKKNPARVKAMKRAANEENKSFQLGLFFRGKRQLDPEEITSKKLTKY